MLKQVPVPGPLLGTKNYDPLGAPWNKTKFWQFMVQSSSGPGRGRGRSGRLRRLEL